VNVEFIENLSHLINKNEESQWQKASASLDASAKIYGYRVDCVHSDTYRVLGSLNRTDVGDKQAEREEQQQREKREKIYPSGKNDGSSTIEKDMSKLDCVKFDMEFDVDPLFRNMTARFNETGARGLLLNNLPIDEHLDILLESKHDRYRTHCQDKFLSEELAHLIQSSFYVDRVDFETSLIFPDINYFKNQTDRKVNHETDKKMEQTFANITINQDLKKRREAKNKAMEKIKIDITDIDEQPVNIANQPVNLEDHPMDYQPMDYQPMDDQPMNDGQDQNLPYDENENNITSQFASTNNVIPQSAFESERSLQRLVREDNVDDKENFEDDKAKENAQTPIRREVQVKPKDNDEYDYGILEQYLPKKPSVEGESSLPVRKLSEKDQNQVEENNENLVDERIQQVQDQIEAEMQVEAQEEEELLRSPDGYDLSDEEIGQIYPEEVNDIFPFENKSLFEGENPETQKENAEKGENAETTAINKEMELVENLKKKDEPVPNHDLDLIRAENIKEHLTKFGTGNKEVAKSIPQIKPVDPVLEAENFKKITILRNKNKKAKKEDQFFIFVEEDEVRKTDIFDAQRLKKEFISETKKDKLTKFKLKIFNFDLFYSILFF
jgi:predicted RNA-binding protein